MVGGPGRELRQFARGRFISAAGLPKPYPQCPCEKLSFKCSPATICNGLHPNASECNVTPPSLISQRRSKSPLFHVLSPAALDTDLPPTSDRFRVGSWQMSPVADYGFRPSFRARALGIARLQAVEAALCVGNIVILAVTLRGEASEPPDESFDIMAAGIERGDPAQVDPSATFSSQLGGHSSLQKRMVNR
jgi:hypothetical protein